MPSDTKPAGGEKKGRILWRIPLAAQILVWFFLNLMLLAAVIFLVLSVQYRVNLDWVFASSARQRVESLRALIVGELNATVPEYWSDVLDRFSDAYGVQISIFDPNGDYLLGRVKILPGSVRERLLSFPQPSRPAPPPSAAERRAREREERNGHRPVSERAQTEPPEPDTEPQPQQFQAMSGPARAFLRTNHPSRYWLLHRTRLDNPRLGAPMRVVLVAEAESFSMGGLILDPVPWIGLVTGTVVFSVIFWLPLLHSITRSIRHMTQTTRQIAEGRFDVRVASRRGDELGSLGDSINQMAGRLNGFVMGQKRFLGDIAHELCSPLARLQMVLGIMEQREEKDEYVQRASEKAEQIAALVNELLTFSRASFGATAVRLTPVAVKPALEEAAAREATDQAEIRVGEIPASLLVLADQELMVRAISNLIRNAVRYGDGGAIDVSAQESDGEVAIHVADSGPGVPEEELPRLFDAFYRLDRSRTRETGGVGLGLTIVKTCVESCQGVVVARNRVPHGLEVEIRLPSASDPA
jgi:two-component system, OmpR family, sensor histidine kinase CpxA